MADITVTAANVLTVAGNVDHGGKYGETITAGDVVYKKASDAEWYKAQADEVLEDDVVGIALNGGGNAQPGAIQTNGTITIGGTVAVGEVYCLSAAAGKICPWSDLVSTNYVTIIGIGISATVIQLTLMTTSVAVPA